jgi:FixJ family two-component response regulator
MISFPTLSKHSAFTGLSGTNTLPAIKKGPVMSDYPKYRNILVLEDEPAHARAIERHLTDGNKDCRVILAGSLAEFEKIISENDPDLVIADINLPDGSAMSILSGDLKNQPWPVLIMTSFGDEEVAVKAIKSGALDYIVKSPEAFSNIKHVVKRNLREWRVIQKSRENEKKFRILFETMDQGVIYQDGSGRITAANSAAERITGYALEEMQDMPFPQSWSMDEYSSRWHTYLRCAPCIHSTQFRSIDHQPCNGDTKS